MKHFILLLCCFLTGCTGINTNIIDTKPRGELLVSIRITDTAFFGPPKKSSGYFFYTESSPPNIIGPRLTGYEFRNGELKDIFGGASESAKDIATFESIGFEPFDFTAEIKILNEKLNKEANLRGETFIGPMVVDGAEYEIVIVTPKGRFVLKEWNPGPSIDLYAQHSEKIAKLKAVLDLLAQYYGLIKFGI